MPPASASISATVTAAAGADEISHPSTVVAVIVAVPSDTPITYPMLFTVAT